MATPPDIRITKITYRDLLKELMELSDEQLECDVTVENGIENECFAAELRICAEEHDSLDEDHPVIYYY